MGVIIRMGAYALSVLALMSFVNNGAGTSSILTRHLTLDTANAMILGVCSGVSTYTGFDVSIIRFAWAVAAMYRGIGILLYILAFLIMPNG